ncbi:MAG: AAA family ATPase [Lachnospiraceae bacterium]|nr:AAA family ATPase [Lachnospiraceae bacterium]
MNISQAKQTIKNTVQLYLKKDAYGTYRIPVVRQRPVFLLGAPGIGKTAIMEQVAQELGIALVSYSMTHHTRQSALGLPFITQKQYGGADYSVSEYTMSEIIASVYETMEESGIKEGILFLDEINCVSETLFPSMLQFLQYKIFGRHAVPEGWVIVTAGNPPEYNRMVREFDVVTMDRMKLVEVEPDLKAWQQYAAEKRLHAAVLNYLEIHREHFYVMELTAKGRSYVTARGWEDLSEILQLYEEEGLAVDEALIGQYLHHEKVVKEFAAYYELFNKYKRDYRITEILKGGADATAVRRAQGARFDERISLLGMLTDRVEADMQEVLAQADVLTQAQPLLKGMKVQAAQGVPAESLVQILHKGLDSRRQQRRKLSAGGALSDAQRRQEIRTDAFLEEILHAMNASGAVDGAGSFAAAAARYQKALEELQRSTGECSAELKALFAFSERAFAEGNELLILLTRLTASSTASRFIANFGSAEYQRLSSSMMVSERSESLRAEILKL